MGGWQSMWVKVFFYLGSIRADSRSFIFGYRRLRLSSSACAHRISFSRLMMRGLVFSWCSIFRMAEFSSLATCVSRETKEKKTERLRREKATWEYLLSMRLLQQLSERTAFGFFEGQQSERSLQFAEHIRIRFTGLGHLCLGECESFLNLAGPVQAV